MPHDTSLTRPHDSTRARYSSLGAKECAFVDKDGRLIADDARCPRTGGYMQGDFQDVTFSFVRARLARCNNGTDLEGKPLPGMCMTPEAIDAKIYECSTCLSRRTTCASTRTRPSCASASGGASL